MNDCLICERVALARAGNNPYLIHEFEHTLFVIGDHQAYRGYALILLKQHVLELHELPESVQQGMFAEMMTATRALVAAFQPDKMNHLCLGNEEAHVHWHIMPRYRDDRNWGRHPLYDSERFREQHIDEATAHELAALIRTHLTV